MNAANENSVSAQDARPSATLPPQPPVALDDYERLAQKGMSPLAWAYFNSGAADELTLRWNQEAYRTLRLLPRQLRDVSEVDMSVTVLEHRLPHPILLAPIACLQLVHPDGEIATASAARAAGAGMVLSSYTTTEVERVATEKPPLFWFQLYVQERRQTEDLIRRAVAAGCSAIVVTVDTPVSGARNRQAQAGFEFPATLPHIAGARAEHPLTWKDLACIRAAAPVPVWLKGILHADDAAIAIETGAAGIMVSNHGGRNLDTAPATIDALPRVVDEVAGRIPVIVDGGIRRGTDVLKALAQGASAVMIGRPYVHGLAVHGAAGVEAVLGILRHELELAMKLTGRPTIESLDRSVFF